MTIRTRLTTLLDIQYPIIQGAFGLPGTGTAQIAVPVSEADALRMLTTIAYKDTDTFRTDVQKAKSLTNKPLTDGRYIQKFYSMKHGSRLSPASGIIDSIPTVQAFIENIMAGAQARLSLLQTSIIE